jgi:hypothetical protein
MARANSSIQAPQIGEDLHTYDEYVSNGGAQPQFCDFGDWHTKYHRNLKD